MGGETNVFRLLIEKPEEMKHLKYIALADMIT